MGESPVFGGIIAAYEGSAFTILCIMVGISALLNGEPCSGFSMRRCDLRHNHSCQLAHYGFCPEPMSDVRRVLSLSRSPSLCHPGCPMKESSLSLAHPEPKSQKVRSHDARKEKTLGQLVNLKKSTIQRRLRHVLLGCGRETLRV